jgi:hypothetical protein
LDPVSYSRSLKVHIPRSYYAFVKRFKMGIRNSNRKKNAGIEKKLEKKKQEI